MSDWLERFKSKEETQTAEELEADFPDDDDIEDDEFQDQPLKELQTFDMDLDDLVRHLFCEKLLNILVHKFDYSSSDRIERICQNY